MLIMDSVFSGIGHKLTLHISNRSICLSPTPCTIHNLHKYIVGRRVTYSTVLLCRLWIVHGVGLRQMLLLLICRVSLWPMPERTDSRARRTQCLLAVHCLLLNSNARLLLLIPTYTCSSQGLAPTMSCSCLVIMTRDFVT